MSDDTQKIDPKARGKVLQEAFKVINGERQDHYGKPEDSFTLIAEYWTTYLKSLENCEIDALLPADVAKMLTLFKIAREVKQHNRDNIRDACGYLALASDMEAQSPMSSKEFLDAAEKVSKHTPSRVQYHPDYDKD